MSDPSEPFSIAAGWGEPQAYPEVRPVPEDPWPVDPDPPPWSGAEPAAPARVAPGAVATDRVDHGAATLLQPVLPALRATTGRGSDRPAHRAAKTPPTPIGMTYSPVPYRIGLGRRVRSGATLLLISVFLAALLAATLVAVLAGIASAISSAAGP